jgi:glycyl-tRNA synthetase beta chain
VGVEADAPPSRQQLGGATIAWAAVSLADKLDSVAGMFAAGERPTGSRDPLGLRRQAQGAVKILADLPELTGIASRIELWDLVTRASAAWAPSDDTQQALRSFLRERVFYLFEQRGFDVRNIRAVVPQSLERFDMVEAKKKLEALGQMSGSDALRGVATLFKRVKNITKDVSAGTALGAETLNAVLKEPAELALVAELDARAPSIERAAQRAEYREAFAAIAALQPVVAKFFDDVLVMAEDEQLRSARLALVARLRDLILAIADISEIVTET